MRVLEIPTPRWSTYDAKALGIEIPDNLDATIQERAWVKSRMVLCRVEYEVIERTIRPISFDRIGDFYCRSFCQQERGRVLTKF